MTVLESFRGPVAVAGVEYRARGPRLRPAGRKYVAKRSTEAR
jgi:hypothetical protein